MEKNVTGFGIEKNNIQEVFDPFFTTKEPGKGRGLGLRTTQQLLTEMGYREETIHKEIDDKAFHVLAYKGLQPVGTASSITSAMALKTAYIRSYKYKRTNQR